MRVMPGSERNGLPGPRAGYRWRGLTDAQLEELRAAARTLTDEEAARRQKISDAKRAADNARRERALAEAAVRDRELSGAA